MNIIVTKKRIKNIIIKIKNDGNVHVSAPFGVSKECIQKIIDKKREWIEKKLSLISEIEKINNFNHGENFKYLGKNFPIEIKISQDEFCSIIDNKFVISLKENTLLKRKLLVEKWVSENFYKYLFIRSIDIGKKMGYTPTKIKLRNMKSRWGSCNTLTKSITFNYQLYKKSPSVIDYVIVHEIAHIPFPHHQKEFWNFVEKFIPNWKSLRKELRYNI